MPLPRIFRVKGPPPGSDRIPVKTILATLAAAAVPAPAASADGGTA